MFGWISSHSILLMCKVHSGAGRIRFGAQSSKGLIFTIFKSLAPYRSQREALWVRFPFPTGYKLPHPISNRGLPPPHQFFSLLFHSGIYLLTAGLHHTMPGLFHKLLTSPWTPIHLLLLTVNFAQAYQATFLSFKSYSCSKTFSGFLWPER